jgi:WS/DGAT/MGAT family acyltransferase
MNRRLSDVPISASDAPRQPRAVIERASPNDLMQLAADLPGTPMQIAAVLVLDAASTLDLAAVREAIDKRIQSLPRLRQRLVRVPFGCGRPIWVDDPRFDITQHVHAVTCPAPGDKAALLSVAADTATRRLPSNRAMWSATLVTSLADGGAALIVTLHHVLADGIGGLAVLAHLVDGTRGGAPATHSPRAWPDHRALFFDALGARLRALAHFANGVRLLRAAITELAAGETARPPRSSLNRPTGTRRSLAVAQVNLESVRRAAHAHGATVNDAILTAVTGTLHAVLRHRGEHVDQFVISVPISTRRESSTTRLGNQVGAMPVPVVATGEPHQRLTAIAQATRNRRPATPSASATVLGPAFRALAWLGALRWFVDRQRLVTTFVTNLRGPDVRLSFLAAPITGVIPVSATTGNVTVAFAALSYAGTLVVTVIADPDRCPDLPMLAALLQDELDAVTDDPAAEPTDKREAVLSDGVVGTVCEELDTSGGESGNPLQ